MVRANEVAAEANEVEEVEANEKINITLELDFFNKFKYLLYYNGFNTCSEKG